VLEARGRPRQFQHHGLAHHIGADIGIRIFQAVAHAGLRRQMHDAGETRSSQGQDRILIGDVGFAEREELVALEAGQPRLFQAYIIIVAEIVDAEHGIAALYKRLTNRGADEAGRACNQYLFQRLPSQTPVANIAGDQLAVNHRFDIGENARFAQHGAPLIAHSGAFRRDG